MFGSYCPREGYKVASDPSGTRRLSEKVTVPVRGIRLHLKDDNDKAMLFGSYCPREGYKVASSRTRFLMTRLFVVTVPVRGIRLHPDVMKKLQSVYRKRYCPREGYKVASRPFGSLSR